jgi:P27 family predicted phage terminase small subunit
MRLLTKVDVAMLSASCVSFGRWRAAEEAIARMARHDEHTGALLVMTDEGAKRNPLIRIANDSARDMRRYAGEFGVMPAARACISAGVNPKPPGKFDGLLA